MNKTNRKYILNILLILGIAVLVYFTAVKGNAEGIAESLANIKPAYLLLCSVMVFLWQLMVALILTVFARLNYPKYRVGEGLINSLVASFFHGITPSASGGQFAQLYVFRKQGVDTSDAASILWMEFIVYQTTMCLYGLVMILLFFKRFMVDYSGYFFFVLIGFFINTCVIVFLYLLGCSKKMHHFLTTTGLKIGMKLHLIKNPDIFKQNLEAQAERFGNECAKLKLRKKTIVITSLLCVLRLSFYYLIPFVVFAALGQKADISLFFDCLAMGSFVSIASSMIPIPGASGGTEAIFVMMFSNLFPGNVATTAMLLWRFFSYYLLLLVGGLSFLYVKVKNRG